MFTEKLNSIEEQIKELQAKADYIKAIATAADDSIKTVKEVWVRLDENRVSVEDRASWQKKIIEAIDYREETESLEVVSLKQKIEGLNELVGRLESDKDLYLERWHEARDNYFKTHRELSELKESLEEVEEVEEVKVETETEVDTAVEEETETETEAEVEVNKKGIEVIHIEEDTEPFDVGDVVTVVEKNIAGYNQTGEVVAIEPGLIKTRVPAGTFSYRPHHLKIMMKGNGDAPPEQEKATEEEIQEFLKKVVASKKLRAEIDWLDIRELSKKDTEFFRTLQLMRKTTRQTELFSEWHNGGFTDMLTAYIRESNDKSDFNWIPKTLRDAVEEHLEIEAETVMQYA